MTREEREYIIYQWAIGADKEHICNCGNFFHFNTDKEGEQPTPQPIPIYRWSASTETICIDYNLYEKEYQYVSYDNGLSWSNTLNSRLGDLIEENSTECGYIEPIEPIYEWRISEDEYICDEETYKKYNKEYQYISYDNGLNWNKTDISRQGSIIEENSTDCGYVRQYVTVDLNNECKVSEKTLEGYQIYESFSNYNIHSSKASMRVFIPTGITEFNYKFGSFGESGYDYVLVGKLDVDTMDLEYTNTSSQYWKFTSVGKASADAPNINDNFVISNPEVPHFFDVRYMKDGLIHRDDDKGYLGIKLSDLGYTEPVNPTPIEPEPIDPEPTPDVEITIKEKLSPTTDTLSTGDTYVICTALLDDGKHFLYGDGSKQLVYDDGANKLQVINITSPLYNGYEKKCCVWQVEEISKETRLYRIKNLNGWYLKQSVQNPLDIKGAELTQDVTLAAMVEIGKGVEFDIYTDNYAFREHDTIYDYGLNNLNSLNQKINWYTKQNVFYTISDKNVYFNIYKVEVKDK